MKEVDAEPIIISSKEKLLFLVKNEYNWEGNISDECSGPFIWLQFASPELTADSAVVLFSVDKNGLALKYASPELRDNKEIVKTAYTQNYGALEFASDNIKTDKSFLLDLLSIHSGHVLEYIKDESLRSDEDIIFKTLRNDGMSLVYVPREIQTKEIVLEAVRENGLAIQHAKRRFLQDSEIIHTAVHQTPNAVKYIPSFVLMNQDFLPDLVRLMSVHPNKIVSTCLEHHREFALELIKYTPELYIKLPDSFKMDWEFVKEHIKGNPLQILNIPGVLWETLPFVEHIIDADNMELVIRNIPLGFLKDRAIIYKIIVCDSNNLMMVHLMELFAYTSQTNSALIREIVDRIFELLTFSGRIFKIYQPTDPGVCRFHFR
jgi:hypothetical protein